MIDSSDEDSYSDHNDVHDPLHRPPPAAGIPSRPLPPQEEQQHVLHNQGYRDGASAGHSAGLQEGFDEGFRKGMMAGEVVGRLLGAARYERRGHMRRAVR